jgi:hypothetical protein
MVKKLLTIYRNITNSGWYCWVVVIMSGFAIFVAANHFLEGQILHSVWDIIVAAAMFFGNGLRIVKLNDDIAYATSSPEYVNLRRKKH